MIKQNEFEIRNKKNIKKMSKDLAIKRISRKWFEKTFEYEYSYHFNWLGLPIIQYPQDILAIQEIIWKTKPDLIIETGIARGGSIIFLASILELLGKGKVVGIDVDIRRPNKIAIEKHPLSRRIRLIKGSSISKEIINQVYKIARNKKKIMVILDSNHTHSHVLKELEFYSPLVTVGNYLIVLDTIVEDLPNNLFKNRPWGKGNNPRTAVKAFLQKNKRFKINDEIEKKLLISVAPSGYLKCIKN